MECYKTFEALGDPIRLEIVERLANQKRLPTLVLVQGVGVSRQAAAKHILVLERAGVIRSHGEGRQVYRELNPEALTEAQAWIQARTQRWTEKLTKLEEHLARIAEAPNSEK
ncbi:MAG: helix-turn-helix transcriptional regulator [Armatimonadetes bacterium]|nr:helix-turn-helix transcriptional regulator [Armatimonadota bacterium]